MPFGFGGSSSSTRSQSQSSGRTFVDPGQAPFLDFLRNTGMSLYQGLNTGISQGIADELGQQGSAILSQLPNIGSNLTGFGSQANIDRQVSALENELGDFYNQTLVPGLRRDAGGAGQLGMSRDMLNRGVAAEGVADAFTAGVADIYGNAEQQRLQAAQSQAGARLGAAQAGLGSLQSLYDLGTAPFATMFAPLLYLSEVFGDPTLLSEQQSSSSSRGKSSSINFASLG